MIYFACTENIRKKVKQFENLKKKWKSINECCFPAISIKICAKQKLRALKVVLVFNWNLLGFIKTSV